jgi:hydrogenase maturation protease
MRLPAGNAETADAALTWIVGLGGQCGDDGAGWHVVGRLRELIGQRDGVRLLDAATPVDLLPCENCSRLILIDACQGLAAPGQTVRLRLPAAEIVPTRSGAGHQVSLSQALEMATQLGQLPADCEIWCVEGCQFEPAQPLSEVVAAACQRVAEQIADEVRRG